ncbi:MAG: YedE-related selenium metabolism membrane protein [Proteobacteria bacterium]|nr:YedE-related selenium metabolism membrane protein [Pseudomonadota bacterium]MBU1716496.1 YedE-related selenium metabolism membrane protein [Pseudomonadota bacterium]
MSKWYFVLMGAVIGVGAVILSYFGNPANTGVCVSCFMENIAGALSLHDNIRMQYIRPEIIGFVLGSFFLSLYRKEFVSTGGSSPLLRFVVGMLLIVGCSIFIGCPVKMFLRLAAGDLGAIIGLLGLIAGIYIGLEFIENGFQLGETRRNPVSNGLVVPGMMMLLLVFVIIKPSFIQASVKGSGAQYAPLLLSLGIGLAIGAMSQFTQFCITGGIARMFLWGPREVMNCPRSSGLLLSIGSFLGFAFVANLLTGQFHLGLQGQPSSNDSYGWAFLAMLLVGFGSVLIKGCPLRQLVAAGQGDNDAGATVMGMLVGAALVPNWSLGGNSAGTPVAGQIAVLAGICLLLVVGLVNRKRGYGIAPEYQTGLD